MNIEIVILIFIIAFIVYTHLTELISLTPIITRLTLQTPFTSNKIEYFTPHNSHKIVESFEDYTDINTLNKIRNILRDVDKLCKINNIKYMMDGGTLLGAVRHNDMIPWDDDGDIVIFNDDGNAEKKLLSLTITLRNMGYGLSKFWGGYRIYYLNGDEISYEDKNWKWMNSDIEKLDQLSVPHKYPFVDVFFMEKDGDLYSFSCKNVRNVWPNYYHFDSDIHPLKEYKFHTFSLVGPKNPEPYLSRAYGNDWKNVGYKSYDHKKQTFISQQEKIFL